jgi:hypothetical protein
VILRRLRVNLGELTEAFDEPRRGPVRTFVDRESGQIEHVPRDVEVEGVFDDILSSPHRWLEIQPLSRELRSGLRRRFADQVEDPQFRLKLAHALAAELPFTRFASVLREVPGLLDRWLAFRNRELDSLAVAWLAAIGVDAARSDR